MRSPEHPCPNHNSVRVPRACGHQRIFAQTTIPLVFQEHPVTKASMPKPKFRSCSKSIRSPKHPCPNHNSVRGPRTCGHQSIPAQIIIPFVVKELMGNKRIPSTHIREVRWLGPIHRVLPRFGINTSNLKRLAENLSLQEI